MCTFPSTLVTIDDHFLHKTWQGGGSEEDREGKNNATEKETLKEEIH
jgi:hypothetical protein